MKALFLSIAGLFVTCVSATAQTEAQCAYDLGAMMRLDYESFDSTPNNGWRALGDTPGCEVAAADLIAAYRTERIEDQVRGLMHHEAQLRAAAGQTAAALTLLTDARSMWSAPEMRAYRNAEIAFLRGDLPALRAAREELVHVPPPRGFDEAVARFRERYPTLAPPSWPTNLDVVDGFIRCFGRPYREAYAASCRGSGGN